jgi:putative cardiolipin synthase
MVTGCAVQTAVERPSPTFAVAMDSTSPLGKLASAAGEKPSGESGFVVLDTGRQAFLARSNLIEAASTSIDAQYYIWNSDASGRYLARRLFAAAERGVRIRLLLDDMNVKGRDSVLADMSRHPNIEIRLYNPASVRQGPGKNLALLRDFQRINRRMHNKTFISDSALAVVGGRNIGDEYFDLHAEVNHRDRDVLALGGIVASIANNFDDYWNSPWSIGVESIVGDSRKAGTYTELSSAQWLSAIEKVLQIHQPSEDQSTAIGALNNIVEDMVWARAELIYDPAVTDMGEDTNQPMRTADALREIVTASKSEVLIESAYLVLAERQLELVEELKARGVRVAAITNSLATNDVTANHAAYARWRPEMVQSGMELHELRPDAGACSLWIETPDYCRHGAVSLHAKSAVFDRKVLYVGSFNFNLRSAYLNGETVLVIYSPELAQRVAEDIELAMKLDNSWRVTDRDGRLQWIYREGDIGDREPAVTWWRRFTSHLISILPIEKYL